MKMRTKKERKLLINNKKHIRKKQNTLLQFETLSHYRNKRIRSYHKNNTFTKREINNIYVKNHESDRIKLWNL